MIITPHVLSGVLVAINCERLHVSNPKRWNRKFIFAASCLIVFCSHFALDFIPHYDYWIYGPDKIASAAKILTDFAMALTISGFILKREVKNLIAWANLQIKNHRLPSAKERLADLPLVLMTLAAIALSLIPDVLTVLSRTTGALTGYRALHDFFHSSMFLKSFWGTVVQLLTMLVLFGCSRMAHSKLNREIERVRKIEREVGEVCAEVAYKILSKK